MRVEDVKDNDMTELEKVLFVLLCEYAFEIEKKAGCAVIAVEKDLVKKYIRKLEKII